MTSRRSHVSTIKREVVEENDYMMDSDALDAGGIEGGEARGNARRVLEYIQRYNEQVVYGENHYIRLEIQAYTIVKILPCSKPWISFRNIY